tara:strand:+ start:4590 stop:5564 length:975 start_codon:yes stop_codon:yes gene_type:complete
MNILITGVAGFIGYHTATMFLEKKHRVIGLDNINNYYDLDLKKARLKNLKIFPNFRFFKFDIAKKDDWKKIQNIKIDKVIHLAAQAGVRFSLDNPSEYTNSNLLGTFYTIDFCKKKKIKHLIFSSSSSVYGNNKSLPFLEKDKTDNPIQFYAATKKSCEVMIASYSALYNLHSDILRLFTVYGPLGRPDMALFKFVKKIYNNEVIEVYNNGNHSRDFTYIDDVVKCIYLISKKSLKKKKSSFDIFNICSGKKIKIMDMIELIKKYTRKKIKISYKKKQIGDMIDTYGNNNKLKNYTKFKKFHNFDIGIKNFVNWYKEFYKIKNE